MNLAHFLPQSINWPALAYEKVPGEKGYTISKTRSFGSILVRQVEYSATYLADHWCNKGHVVHILSGELVIEHRDGTTLILKKDMTYLVGDESMPHRASSSKGALALIVD